MRSYWLFAASIFAAPALAADKPTIGPVPAWVQPFPAAPAQAAPAKALPADAPVQMLRLDQQVRFGPDGDDRYVETAVKILTPQGLAAMGTIALPWQPDISTLTVHKLNIVRGDRTIEVLKNQQLTVLRREEKLESAILSGVLTATIQPEDLQVGDIVEMAFTVHAADPVLKGHSEYLADVPAALPGGRVHIAAQWPAGDKIVWRKSALMQQPKVWQDKDGGHVEVTLEDVEPLPPPKGAPLRFLPLRQIEFTNYPSWSAIGAVMAPLYDKASAISAGSPLAAEVDKIRAATSDPKQRAAMALKLVQDRVRYVYQGMNSGNLMPANAADTWSRRFGDCKGKTALLLGLLRALDIKAEPAAVSTVFGDGLDAREPMVGLLDHILIRADIGGKTYWLDGTRLGDSDIDKIQMPGFRWAVPVRPGGGALIALAQSPLDRPNDVTNVRIDARNNSSKAASIEVETVMRGDDALQVRLQLANLNGTALETALRAYWKGRFDGLTVDKAGAAFDDATGEEKLTLAGKLDLTTDSYGYELDGASLGWKPDYQREPGPNADAPIAINFPFYATSSETILLPKGHRDFRIEGDDVDKTISGYAFTRRTTIEGDAMTMQSSTRALRQEISYRQALADSDALAAMHKVRVYLRGPIVSGMASASAPPIVRIEQAPSDTQGFLTRGNASLDRGEYDKAIADFDKALALDADNAWAYADRGIAHAWKNEKDKALDDLDKAAARNPRLPQVFHGRALVLENSGDAGGAIAALSRAIELDAGDSWALGRRAALYIAAGRYDQALADTRTMQKIHPDDTYAMMLSEHVELLNRHYDEALAMVDKLAQRAPDNADSLDVERGYILARMGKSDDARALFAKLRQKAAKNGGLFNALCWNEGQANFDLPTALADCEAAIKLDPQPAYLDSSGLVLLRMGRFDEAIKRYDRALTGRPDMPASLYGRGIAKLRSGQTVEGQTDLQNAKDRSPHVESMFAEMGVKP